MDDISTVRGYFEPKAIINLNYIASSLTYNDGGNPSFRIYSIDSSTMDDYDHAE